MVPICLEESDIKSDDKKCVWVNLGFIPFNYIDLKDRGSYSNSNPRPFLCYVSKLDKY